MISRLQVARYVADLITRGERTEAVRHAAAWLLAAGRKHQAAYLAQDVAQVLTATGYGAVTVTSAQALSKGALETARSFACQVTGCEVIELATKIDPALVGGLRLDTPTATLDASVSTQLTNLVKGGL